MTSSRLRTIETYLLISILSYTLFSLYAAERLIAPDEGFYLLAARLVSEGQNLYKDFFFPQMPYSAWAYGGWIRLFGNTIETARSFSVLLSSLICCLLFYNSKKASSTLTAFSITVLFAVCNFIFPWYVTVQTYALSVLLLFLSYTFLNLSRPKYLLAGMALGLAIGTRLFFAGLTPLIFLYLWNISTDRKQSFKNIQFFIYGLLIALLPVVFLIIQDPDTFWFNNFGYHLTRSNLSGTSVNEKSFKIIKNLFGFRDSVKYDAPHSAILLYLSSLSLIAALIRKKRINLAWYLIAGLFVLNLLPSPPYMQYFCTLVPFLFITVSIGISELKINKLLLTITLFASLFLYLQKLPSDYEKYFSSGAGVIGVGQESTDTWSMRTVKNVSSAINKYSSEGDLVLSFWSGYLFETDTQPLPGTESRFALLAADKLSTNRKDKYGIIGMSDIQEAVKNQTPRILVINNKRRKFLKLAKEADYSVKETVNNIVILKRD